MSILGLDFETYSETNIAKCGSYRYMEDPAFEILLTAFAYDEDAPTVLDHLGKAEAPSRGLLLDLKNPAVTKTAWNAAFERYAIWRAWRIYSPPEQWEDTMILAGQCGLPMSLAGASAALGLGEDEAKMKEGKALIRYFCNPCQPTKTNGGRTRNLPEHAPEKWDLFCQYNGQDVVAERAIRNRLRLWKPLPEEHRFWCVDARINEHGVRIDRRLAQMAVAMDLRNKEELTAKAIELTGMENPKSVSQIKQWLFDQEGKRFPSLNKKVIADVVSSLQTEEARQFMALRTELSKSSVAKYDAMLRSMSAEDDHVRGCFAFYGANRTGRFAGRLVQFQNMSKNYMDDLDTARQLVRNGEYTCIKYLWDGVSDVLSQLVRTAILPEEGHTLLVSDFSAIEARVIAWIAEEEWRLDVFRNGGDIYCASASQMFKVPVVKHGENGHLRQKGKVAELALGYGGGVNALKAFGADKMGMTDEEMQETVDLWRESSPKICSLWRALEKAAIRAIVRKGTATSKVGNIRFDYEQGILWMTLPSGRRIAYWGAKYEESRFHPGRKAISYMGVNQQSKKWERVETWGGKLAENLTQATARDCLREAMFHLEDAGYTMIAHVHDEVLVTEPIGGRTVEEMSDLMGQPIPWAPGLPLRADGYSTPYYIKD
jgi:DNA polymerase